MSAHCHHGREQSACLTCDFGASIGDRARLPCPGCHPAAERTGDTCAHHDGVAVYRATARLYASRGVAGIVEVDLRREMATFPPPYNLTPSNREDDQ